MTTTACAAGSPFGVVSPSDCTLLVGIATSERGFVDDAANPEQHRFSGLVHRGGISAYRHDVIEPFAQACRVWRRWGVDVQADATSATLHSAMRSRTADVLIVFSHYDACGLELRDGMLPDEAWIAAVPAGWHGVLDLCACMPMRLVAALNRKAPGASVCFADAELTPMAWFGFYSHLFLLLRQERLSYLQAMERTCLKFIHAAPRSCS